MAASPIMSAPELSVGAGPQCPGVGLHLGSEMKYIHDSLIVLFSGNETTLILLT